MRRGGTCILCGSYEPIECPFARLQLSGLHPKLLTHLVYIILYFKNEAIITLKREAVDLISAVLSKEKTKIKFENNIEKALTQVLMKCYDYVLKEGVTQELEEILMTVDPEERNRKLKQYVEDIIESIEDRDLKNIIEKLKNDKSAVSLVRIIKLFPSHRPILEDDKDIERSIKANMKRLSMAGKKEADYILDEWDDSRYAAYKKGGLDRFIALHGTYFYIYKKYKVKDPLFWLLLELEETLDERVEKTPEQEAAIKELKDLIRRKYGVDLDEESRIIMGHIQEQEKKEEERIRDKKIEVPF